LVFTSEEREFVMQIRIKGIGGRLEIGFEVEPGNVREAQMVNGLIAAARQGYVVQSAAAQGLQAEETQKQAA
jgi:hypothetical protein